MESASQTTRLRRLELHLCKHGGRALGGPDAAGASEQAQHRRLTAVIIGPPGGGKGTISNKIVDEFSFHHISTGDELRRHVADKTGVGVEAKAFMDSGSLVPDDLMVRLVLAKVSELPSTENILLDGFPRTVSQAATLQAHLQVDLAIHLDIPSETIMQRAAARWIHRPSGRT